MQVNIIIDRLCCFHPLLQNLRNGWLKLFVVVLVPVQYVHSVYYTISTNDVPKAFGMFVRVFLVMPNRLFDSFLKVEGTLLHRWEAVWRWEAVTSKVSQPRSIQDEKQFKFIGTLLHRCPLSKKTSTKGWVKRPKRHKPQKLGIVCIDHVGAQGEPAETCWNWTPSMSNWCKRERERLTRWHQIDKYYCIYCFSNIWFI